MNQTHTGMIRKYQKATIPNCIKTQVKSSSLFTPVTANAGCWTCYNKSIWWKSKLWRMISSWLILLYQGLTVAKSAPIWIGKLDFFRESFSTSICKEKMNSMWCMIFLISMQKVGWDKQTLGLWFWDFMCLLEVICSRFIVHLEGEREGKALGLCKLNEQLIFLIFQSSVSWWVTWI